MGAGFTVGAQLLAAASFAGLAALLWWRTRPGAGGARLLELREQLRLEPKRSLYVVRFGERVLLLGATDHGIETLAETDAGALAAAEAPPRPTLVEPDAAPTRAGAVTVAHVADEPARALAAEGVWPR